jgi:hypothetical protein
MRSANRTPLSADGRTVSLVIYATGRQAICGVNPGRRPAARSVLSASRIVEQEDAMSTMSDPATPPSARWSVGGVFLEALATRDYPQMASTLSADVRLRAMLPPGPMDWNGADDVAAVFTSWFGDAEDFELIDATVGEVGGRLHLSWRLRVRPAPFGIGDGWHVIEQQAYADAAETIDTLDLLCSGFRPDRVTEGT